MDAFSNSFSTTVLHILLHIYYTKITQTGLPFRPHTRRRKGVGSSLSMPQIKCLSEHPEVARQGGYSPPSPPRFYLPIVFRCVKQSSQANKCICVMLLCLNHVQQCWWRGSRGAVSPPASHARGAAAASSSTAVMVAGVQGGSQPPCLAESSVAATKGV